MPLILKDIKSKSCPMEFLEGRGGVWTSVYRIDTKKIAPAGWRESRQKGNQPKRDLPVRQGIGRAHQGVSAKIRPTGGFGGPAGGWAGPPGVFGENRAHRGFFWNVNATLVRKLTMTCEFRRACLALQEGEHSKPAIGCKKS